MPWNFASTAIVQEGVKARVSGPLPNGAVVAAVAVGFNIPVGNITFILSREAPLTAGQLDGESILLDSLAVRGRAGAVGFPPASWEQILWLYHVRNSRLPSPQFNLYLWTP